MQTSSTAVLLATVLAAATACELERDTVAAGYYGPIQAGRSAMASAATGAGAGTGAASPLSPTVPPGRSDPPAQQPAAPMSSAGKAGGSAGTPAAMGGSDSAPMTGGCEMGGRWLSTLHAVADALGQLQYAHYFHYFELDQQGDKLTVAKGLVCGWDSLGGGAFATTVDFHNSWSATISRVNYKGVTGTVTKTSAGCKLDIQKWYSVRGATIPHYTDPTIPLPTADQKATDTTPGWEDWDGDGNPGITGIVSGVVNGKIFVAPRMWTTISGTVADVSAKFKVPLQWDQEPNVMSYDGSPLLGSTAVRAADATLHFAQFARLSADQATGDDAAICKAIVQLAPMLTPEAAGM